MNKLSGNARTAAVVKDNAYGLGLEQISKSLYKAGAKDFFVKNIEEGIKLRDYVKKANIFVLSEDNIGQERSLIEANLIPVLYSSNQLKLYSQLLSNHQSHCYALQIDTGFNRLGLSIDEALSFAENFDNKNQINNKLSLIISHLACAENQNSPMNASQLNKFMSIATKYQGIEASLSASAGIFLGKEYHFQLTRPGIALYGGTYAINKLHPMRTVVTAEARIILIRTANAGEIVSYGGEKKLKRNSLIAVAAIGYCDGYPLSLSGIDHKDNISINNVGQGFIKGYKVPILGKITMDMTMFDITDCPGIEVGDYIQVFGPNIKLDDVANASGTTNYELLVQIGNKYARHYI
ncbi:Alanine racemase [Candidatus Liberibacter americanus str. Sao Paulo]|uniref:Alanine racemase n=2 Tax=Candidatus Liberibacter americanus TaxID=309868 RepID=U6B3U5_9HYPH|nr:Alanine racemase [Candidatus Liberibacter americanus str. Sao Paulo]